MAILRFWLGIQYRESTRCSCTAHQQEVQDGFWHCRWCSISWSLVTLQNTVPQHSVLRVWMARVRQCCRFRWRSEVLVVDRMVLDCIQLLFECDARGLKISVPSNQSGQRSGDCGKMSCPDCRWWFLLVAWDLLGFDGKSSRIISRQLKS